MELITGASATAHISAQDDAAIYDAIVGASANHESFRVLDYGDGLEITQTDDGFQVGTGVAFWYGRALRQATKVSFVVPTEGQSGRRRDIFGIHFKTDPDGTEHCDFEIISGTPTTGTPVEPKTPPNADLSKGATEAFAQMASINVTGTTFTISKISGYDANPSLATTSNIAKRAETFLDNLATRVLDAAHPVGSIVWLINSKTPNSLGYPGTWARMDYVSLRTNANTNRGLDIRFANPDNEALIQIYDITQKKASQSWQLRDGEGRILTPWVRNY